MAVDPDRLLQKLIDSVSTELRRIRANARAGMGLVDGRPVTTCPVCERDFGMSTDERKWLIEAGKLVTAIAFGARKIIAERMLRGLSEGQLDAFARGMEDKDKPWLPEP